MVSSPVSSPGVKDTSTNPTPLQKTHTGRAATPAGTGWHVSHPKGPLQMGQPKVTTRPTGPASEDALKAGLSGP